MGSSLLTGEALIPRIPTPSNKMFRKLVVVCVIFQSSHLTNAEADSFNPTPIRGSDSASHSGFHASSSSFLTPSEPFRVSRETDMSTGFQAPSASLLTPSISRREGSSSYGAPSYDAPHEKSAVEHNHHHYYHDAPPPRVYHAPKPTYHPPPTYQAPRPTYNPPPTYHAPAPTYHQPQPVYDQYAPSYYGHTYYDDDEYVHLNKKEVTKGALLFGAGLLKGVIVTGLINSANNGITIGKKDKKNLQQY